jgi:nucleotide-binding universal stress UspA family protein
MTNHATPDSATIVVGFTPSPEGWAAVRAAVGEARMRNGKVVVVHSVRGENEEADDYIAYREALAEVEDYLASDGVSHEINELVRGRDPADDILDVCTKTNAALIVIGIRQRSQIGKLLLGSNALAILHDARCPVLAVKADQA